MLAQHFEAIHFVDIKDRYTAPVTDLPTTTTSYATTGKTKTVTDYYGAPQSIVDLESEIDRVAGIKELIGTCTSRECE